MGKNSFTPYGKMFCTAIAIGLLLMAATSVNAQASTKKMTDEQVTQIMGAEKPNIAFIENKGQWPGHVLFRADLHGAQMLATPQGMLVGAYDPATLSAAAQYETKVEQLQKGLMPGMSIKDLGPVPVLKGHGWRFNFIGGSIANAQTLEKKGESFDYYNYLIGDESTHATYVHSYDELMYKNVYEGVDVKYYTSTGGELENDIVIKPGVNANQVKIQIEGIAELKLNEKGDIIMPTTVGDMIVPSPQSYLIGKDGQRTKINITYKLTGKNTLAFNIPAYDNSKTLVIDPIVMRWATMVSNNAGSDSHCHGIDLDASGNIYVTGKYQSGLITVGAFQTADAGNYDLFIGKYQEPATPGNAGTRVWQTYLGGSASDNPYALDAGPDGNIYIAVNTSSNWNKTYGSGFTAGAWTQRTIVGQQVVLAKVNSTGTGALVREIGTVSNDMAVNLFDLRVLKTGTNTFDLIATGFVTQQSTSADGDVPAPVTPSGTALGAGNNGNRNGYIFRITNDFATISWAKQYGTGSSANQFNIAVLDNSNNILVGGLTNSANNVSFNNPSGQTTRVGSQDGWLVSLASVSGACNWSRYFNSSSGNSSTILCMEVNTQLTQVFIGGLTTGLASVNVTAGTVQTTYGGGNHDFFVASLPVSGAATTWGTYFGGNGDESNMMGLNVDLNNDVYVLGYSVSKNIPTATNPIQTNTYDANNSDAIFFKLTGSTGATLQYSTYLGGSDDETDPVGERGIRFNNCRIYLAITTNSNDFPLTQNTLTSNRLSGTGSGEPILVSMANPPDLTGNSITSGTPQTITCGQTPQPITAGVPSYVIPRIIRNQVLETNSTASAYPSGLPTISSYQWQQSTDGGVTWTNITGATGQNFTPTVINSFIGTYKYRRIINNDACNLAGDTLAVVVITVTPPYAAPPITTNSPVCVGQTLNLSTTLQTGFTYAWSGPNTFSSTSQTPSISNVTAAAGGKYFLTITNSTNGCPSYPDSATVVVNTSLAAPTGGSNSPVCSGGTLNLTASGSGTTFSWTGPNSFSSSSQNPSISNVTSANAGNYLVTQSNGGSCTSPATTVTVVVNTIAAPTGVSASPNPICSGNTLTLTATALSGDTLKWNFPDGGTATGSPVTRTNVTTAMAGNYTVFQKSASGCTSGKDTVNVVVNQTPSAPTFVASANPICTGNQLTLTASGAGGATFTWTTPSGAHPTGNPFVIASVALSDSGNYSVTQTVSGCTSPSSANTKIVVNPTPVISGATGTNPTTCGGTDGSILVNGLTAGKTYAVSYTLNGTTNVGPLSLTANGSGQVNITGLGAGSYSNIIVSLSGCPSAPFAGPVVLSNPSNPLAPTVSSNSPVCSGTALTLSASGAGGATFAWTGPNGFSSSSATPTISNAARMSLSGGSYCATQTVAGCTGPQACTTVTVDTTPAVTTTAKTNPTTCAGTNGTITLNGLQANQTYSVTYTEGSTPVGPVSITSNGSGQLVITGLNAGSYTNIVVKLAICSSSPVAGPIVLTDPATPGAPTVSSNSPVCSGNPLTLSAVGAGPTFAWTSTTGYTSSAQNPTVSSSATTAMSGNYCATQTDSGCTSPQACTSVIVNATPVISGSSSSNPTTCGGSDGSITLTGLIAGQTYAVTYVFGVTPVGPVNILANGSGNVVITGLAAGSYTSIVVKLNGCPSAPLSGTITLSPPTTPSAPTVGSNSPVCSGNALTLSASGQGGATYSWTGPHGYTSSTQSPTVSATATTSLSGSYCATQTVAGCTSPQACTTATVDTTPHITSTSSINPSTCGGTNGSITLNGLTAGTAYSVTYLKNGGSQGPFSITANGSGQVIISGLGIGTYSNIVVALSPCSSAAVGPITLVNPTGPNHPTAITNAPVCAGSMLTIGVNATAGGTYSWTGPLSYNASNQNDTVSASATTGMSGVYKVVVTLNACQDSSTVSVTVNANPSATAGLGGTYCAGSGDSVILGGSPTASGGNSPYTYSWTPSTGLNSATASNPVAKPVGSTTYTVTVTDFNGCKGTAAATVTVNPTPTAKAGTAGGYTSCAGSNDTLGGKPTASGGTSPYSYSWNNGASPVAGPIVNPVTTTTYTVTVTDSKGCSATSSTTVNVNQTPTANAGGNFTLPGCSPTGITIGGAPTASGGKPGYTYLWSPTGGLSSSTISNPTVQGILNTTTYNVTVTDANGCTASAQSVVTVTNNRPDVSISSSGPLSWCAGSASSDNLTATVNGGSSPFTYAWSGSSITPTNSSVVTVNPNTAGTYPYTVTITDNFNCTATATTTVSVNSLPTVSAGPGAGFKVCTGSGVVIGGSPTASGGSGSFSYSWSSGASPVANPTVSPIANTSYSVTVTDTKGCSATATTFVTVNSLPHADAGPDRTMPACSVVGVGIGGSPTASGGHSPYTYNWSPATGLSSPTNANPVVSGIADTTGYTLVVTDSNGCTASDQVIVNVTTGSSLQVVIIENTSLFWCQGSAGQVTLTAIPSNGSGPYSYIWTGVHMSVDTGLYTTVNPDTAGIYLYSVQVTDATGCKSGNSVQVEVFPQLFANAGTPQDTICTGANATLGGNPTAIAGTPPYTYQWTGGAASVANPVVSPSSTTTYTVLVTDSNNCSATASSTVDLRTNPTASAGPDITLATCSPGQQIGGSPTASGGGGAPFTYSWTPAVGLSSTTGPDPIVSGLTADTTYTVVVTDANGCSASDQVQVTVVNRTPSVSISASGPTSYCSNSGASLNLTANVSSGTPSFSYNWSGTSIAPLNSSTAAVNPSVAGTYTYHVTITDAQNCTASATKSVTVDSVPRANAGASNHVVCSGTAVTLGGSPTASGGVGPYTYSWTSGATSVSNPSVTPLSNTSYTVVVTDANGCTASASTFVKVLANPTADAGVDKTLPTCSPTGIQIGGSPTASGGGGAPYTYSWSPSVGLSSVNASNPQLIGLTTDTTYTIVVTDANSCSASDQVRITVSGTAPSASISASNSTEWCAGSNTTINLTANVSGATLPLAYSWNGGTTPSNAQVVAVSPNVAGSYTYTVTITDANNCTAMSSKTVVVDSVPTATASLNGSGFIICSGFSVVIGGDSTASGGNWPYTFAWSGGAAPVANPTVSPLSTTTYTVTVTDSKGCTATSSATVTVHSNPTASAGPNVNLPSCSPTGVQIGGTPTASGGLSPYTYSWNPATGLSSSAAPDPTVSGILNDTTYTVVVTDANNCSASAQVAVNVVNTTPSVAITSSSAPEWCSGSGTTTNLTANVTGGNGTLFYNWSGTAISPTTSTTATVSPSAAGSYNYTITVTDAANCTATASKTIIVDSVPSANGGGTRSTCAGGSVKLGSIPLASHGNPPYTYAWSGGAGTTANPTVTPVASVVYTVTVTDSKGCTATTSTNVVVKSNPVANAGPDKTLPGCSPTGIQIGGTPTGSGGDGGPYTFSWSPAVGLSSTATGNPTVIGLTTDTTYTVVVTDNSGCTASDQVAIHVTNTPPVVNITSSGTSEWCSGSNTSVTLTANVAGGSSPFSYSWSGTNISPTNGAAAGINPGLPGSYTYTVTITDGFNCTASTTKTIIVDSLPTAHAGGGNSNEFIICGGSSVTIGDSVTATGGVGPYTYAWSGGAAPVANPTVSPVATTTYTVTVTDSKGCTATASSTVVVRNNPVASAGSNQTLPTCSPTGITIGGSPTASGGSGGPYTYHWSPSVALSADSVANPTVIGLATDTIYTVVVTDVNGCTASSTVKVTVSHTSPLVTISSSNSTEWCANTGASTNLSANVTGGNLPFSYSWSGSFISPVNSSVANVNPGSPGTYTYTVVITDQTNCTASATKTIKVDSLPSADAGGGGNGFAVCDGGSVIIGGSPTASGGTGPYTYSWSGGAAPIANPTVSPQITTTYIVTVTDKNGCNATADATVTVRPTPTANAGSDQNITTCSADSVTIGGSPSASGGTSPYIYTWTPSTGLSDTTASNPVVKGITSSQTYVLFVSDKNGCTSADNVVVNVVPSTLQANISNTKQTCGGPNACVQLGGLPSVFGGVGPYVFAWSGAGTLDNPASSNPVACPTITTTYSVTISDSKGCSVTATQTVIINSPPVANAGKDTAVCAGSSITIGGSPSASGGSGPYTYSWSPTQGLSLPNVPNPSASPNIITTYELTVTDNKGCTASSQITIAVNSDPTVNAGSDRVITPCPGDTVFLGGFPDVTGGGATPYTYLWIPGTNLSDASSASPYVTGLTVTTSYELIVTDSNGCKGNDFVLVNVVPSTLQASAGNDQTICGASGTPAQLGGSPTAVGGTSPYTYSWAPANGLSSTTASNPTALPSVTRTYYVTVTDAKGCTSVDSVIVKVNPAPVANAGKDTSVCSGFAVILGGNPTASGGTSGYQYLWSPTIGLNSNNTSNPTAFATTTTTYVLTVTDAAGCQALSSITIFVNPNPTANAGPDVTLSTCSGDSAQLGGTPSASGGTSPYSYVWSPAGDLSCDSCCCPWVKSGVAGTLFFSVTVTDVNGCSSSDQALVTFKPSNLTASAGNGGSICQGSGAGIAIGGNTTAVGGTPSYTYAWSPALGLSSTTVSNPVANPSVTTKYYVTVTDAKGCVAVDSVLITVYPSMTVNAGKDTTICNSSTVQLGGSPTVSGGFAPYHYSWSPALGLSSTTASNPFATPLITTSYTVTVTGRTGCTATATITIKVKANPTANAGLGGTLVACAGDSLQLGGTPSGNGGSGPPYTYVWSPAGGLSCDSCSNPYVSHLGSGATYTLVVTDSNGCSAQSQVSVTVKGNGLTATAGVGHIFCAGSVTPVTLGGSPTAAGGNGVYTYVWSPSTGLSSTTIANPSATATTTTVYHVVVTDGNGCIATDSVRITVNPKPIASAGSNDTICSGSLVQIGGSNTASGGTGLTYTYSWSPSLYFVGSNTIANPTVQPTTNVTYTVTVTDSLGCTASSAVSVVVNQNPTANAGTAQTIFACPLACANLGGSPTASGGTSPYRYAWSPSAGLNNTGFANPSACNLSSSVTYQVTVTDKNNCTATSQVAVNVVKSDLTADAGADKSICQGQSSGVVIGGSPSASGGKGPYVYDWNPASGILTSTAAPNPTANPSDTTTYVLLVEDALGCIALDSMTVFVDPAISASVGSDTAVCAGGGSVTLGGNPTGSGGTTPYTYVWNPGTGLTNVTSGNPTATPVTTTTYCVTVTDKAGCTASVCQTVNINSAVIACAGPQGGLTMTACPGSFTQLGCTPTATGGSGNYSYTWSPDSVNGVKVLNGATVPNPIVTGLTTSTLFTVTVTDNATGCSATAQVNVTVNPNTLTAEAGNDQVFCGGSTTCLTVGGNPTATGGFPPYHYGWSPIAGMNNPTVANPCVQPTVTTTYIVTVTDRIGCNATDSVTIVVNPQMAVNAGADTSICYGQAVTLGSSADVIGGTAPYNYSWSPSQYLNTTTGQHPTAQNVTGNVTYTLLVTDSFNCSATGTMAINVRPLPSANAGPNAAIYPCTGDSAILGGTPTGSGTVGPYTYSWTPPFNVSLSCLTCPNPVVSLLGHNTQFCVTVTDTFGCQATSCTQVTVLPNTVYANATPSSLPTLCANTVGGCVTLGGSPAASGGVPGYTYSWTGGNLTTPGVPHPQACPASSTTYTLIVTDSKGCQAADSVTVIVNKAPVVTVTGLKNQYCINAGNVIMTGIPSGGTFSGPGVTGNVFQPSVVGTGNWCIKYAYTDPTSGCTGDTIICVNVNPLPVLSITGYSNNGYCQSDPAVTLTGTPAGGTFSGTGMTGNVFNPATANIGSNVITYSYTDTTTGCSNSTQVTINVKGNPTLSVSVSADTVCSGQSVTLTPTYSVDVFNIIWSKVGGGTIAGGTSPITVTPAGLNYCVVASAVNTPNGCIVRDTICLDTYQPPFITDPLVVNTCENQSVPVNPLSVVIDPQGAKDTVSIIVPPVHGTLVSTGNGTYTYTPAPYFFGQDSFKFTACNAKCSNTCVTGEGYISVCYTPVPPVIIDTTITIYENDSAHVCPDIYDLNGLPLIIGNAACGTINGQLIFTSDSCFEFIPTLNWVGTQTLCITVCDTAGLCDTGTVTIHVLPVNHAPIAFPIQVYECRNEPIGINVAASTVDPDANPMTYSYGSVAGPGAGTMVSTGNGAAVFVASVPGVYTIPYTVCDHSQIPVFSLCTSSVITVTVIACDTVSHDSIAANNDGASTNVGTPVTINELGNDYYPNPDSLTVTIIQGPGLPGATASVDSNGQISYSSPTPGVDTIQYQICDPAPLCATAFIIIYVDTTPTNIHYPPVAVDDFDSTNYETTVVVPVLNNDNSPTGDSIHVTGIISGPNNGTTTINPDGTVSYTPDSAVTTLHPDTFVYQICDVSYPNLCDTATVVIYIRPNDAPPSARREVVYACLNTPIGVNVAAATNDPNGLPLTYTYGNPVGPGTLTVTITGTGAIVVTGNKSGSYVIPYTVCNHNSVTGNSLCASSQILVHVIACDSVPSDSIVANDDGVTTNVNAITVINELGNDFYPTPDSLTVTIISPPVLPGATATVNPDGTITYTSPTAGVDTIEYMICDPSPLCDTALIFINVDSTPTNIHYPPVAVDDFDSTNYKEPITVPVLTNDHSPSGDSISVTAIPCKPGEGTAVLNANGTITYTPGVNANALHPDTFCYVICDVSYPSLCDTAQVVIYVRPSVEAVNDTDTTNQHNPIIINVVGNDTTPEHDSIYVKQVITTGTVGTVIINPDGTITYIPKLDTCGFIDSFQYVAATVLGAIDTGTVYVSVVCCTSPVAIADSFSVQSGDTLVFNPFLNDKDSGLVVTGGILTPPTNGVVTRFGSSIMYIPNPGFCGTDHMTYVGNSTCGSDTGTITVTVLCHVPPVANNDTAGTCSKNSVTINVISNDSVQSGLTLTLTSAGPPIPSNLGSITGQQLNGQITFQSVGVTGNVVIPYTVCDNGAPQLCSTASLTITITDCQKPTVDTIYDTTLTNTPGVACVGIYVHTGGLPWSIDSLCNPQNGTDSINLSSGDTCLTYIPGTNFHGNDTFCITICDTFGCTSSVVIYTVIDTNMILLPIPCDLDTTLMDSSHLIDVFEITKGNVLPVPGDTVLGIQSQPANGAARVFNNTTILYIPNKNYKGTDEFSYQVCVNTKKYGIICDTASICVDVVDTTHNCFIPDGFSPNGDHVNDNYEIPCNDLYPKSSLKVYSRWGDQVWDSKGPYQNNWDGRNQQGDYCPTGTYFIIYDYNDGVHKSIAKFVVLNR